MCPFKFGPSFAENQTSFPFDLRTAVDKRYKGDKLRMLANKGNEPTSTKEVAVVLVDP